MNMQNAQERYEEKLADHFVGRYFPSYLGSRKRIVIPPPRNSDNLKIPDFTYSDAKTGGTIVLELTTLTEDDEKVGKIRNAWGFANDLERRLRLGGKFNCLLPIESIRDDLLDKMVQSISIASAGLEKGVFSRQQQPIPYSLEKENDQGSELIICLFSGSASDLDESKLKNRLFEEVCEANSKFEGYQKSMRILLDDISYCIDRDFSWFSLWEIPDRQLNTEIKRTCPRVDCVYLCKTTLAWRGTGEPIPAHGHQAGIARLRIVPRQRSGLPQYQDIGYWEYHRLMDRRK